MLLSLFMTAFAWGASAASTCTTLERETVSERKDILPSDMTTLFEESKGCVTVIELWASWCGPCVKIAPDVEAFHTSHPNVASSPFRQMRQQVPLKVLAVSSSY